MYKYKNNLGMSLVGTLVALALLSVFIYIFSSFFKNYYSTRSSINSSSKSLDISSSIVYEVFEAMGLLTDNLGRGNCQNLNIEDVLTDLYRCDCTTGNTCDCSKFTSKNFLSPVLGLDDSDFTKNSVTGTILSKKFSSIYKIKPQTKEQLKANNMPEDVINRCFNTSLLSIARETEINTQEKLNKQLQIHQELALVQEYFTLTIELFKDEVKLFKLYSTLKSSNSGLSEEDRTQLNSFYYYPERTSLSPNPQFINTPKPERPNQLGSLSFGSSTFSQQGSNQLSSPTLSGNGFSTTPKQGSTSIVDNTGPQLQNGTTTGSDNNGMIISNYLIECGFSTLAKNNRSDQSFTCVSYAPSNKGKNLLKKTETQIISEYDEVRNTLISLKNKYEYNENITKITNELIKQFSKTDSNSTQESYGYLDKVIRLSKIYQDERFNQYGTFNLGDYQTKISEYTQRYNEGLEPFTPEEFDITTLQAQGKFCDRYSVRACFNIQDNNSGTDFLAGSKDKSSIILEVKAYPMSVDSTSSSEDSLKFYQYNDSGSLNRVLKMIYILHWTKNIDGKYKYFRNTGSLTMATSSNLRK